MAIAIKDLSSSKFFDLGTYKPSIAYRRSRNTRAVALGMQLATRIVFDQSATTFRRRTEILKRTATKRRIGSRRNEKKVERKEMKRREVNRTTCQDREQQP